MATTFHGKGVFPDDHPHALGAVGFMRHDYVNFGFDEADVIVSVGYELQEFDPVRINPNGDKAIIHLSRLPAEVDAHYDVEVGVQADIGRTLDALAAATTQEIRPGRERRRRSAQLLAEELALGTSDDSFPLKPQRMVADTRAALGPIGHRPRRHRRGEDVDGAALPHLRAQHLPDLERPVHHGVRPARGYRSEARLHRIAACSRQSATERSS